MEGMYLQEKTTFGLHLFGASVRAAFKMAAVWLAGMTVGGFLSTKISSVFNPYFDHILSAGFSVWSVMHILLVPLFASICLYVFFGPDGVLPVVFLKAFGFSLTVAICAVTFKDIYNGFVPICQGKISIFVIFYLYFCYKLC